MLGEFVRPREYNRGIHFERFAAVAKDSNIPSAFDKAYLAVVNQVAPHKDGDIDYARFDDQAVADRLLGTRFASRERAQYALMYCSTVSTFKHWNQAQTSGALNLPEFGDIAEHSARAMLHTEQNFANPDNSQEAKAARRAFRNRPIKRRSILSVSDLAEVRTYVENYFADNQNQAKILLLGE